MCCTHTYTTYPPNDVIYLLACNPRCLLNDPHQILRRRDLERSAPTELQKCLHEVYLQNLCDVFSIKNSIVMNVKLLMIFLY